MNPTVFAMRRPVTTLMLVVALISGGVLAYTRMRVDIFPSLNVPKIYVFLDYIGMSPDQMEGFIVNQLELYFQYVDGIQDIDTRNIQQVALCRALVLPRHRHGPGDGPGGRDVGPGHVVDAQGNVAADDHAHGCRQRPGRLPRVREQETSLGAMGDLAQNVIRPLVQKFVPGTVAISPFGPNMRSIVDQRRPAEAARLQPDAAAGHRRRGDGEHDHSGGEHLYQGFDAGGRQQRDRRRHPASWARSRSAGEKRLPPRRGDDPGRYRHHVRICAGQRQEVGLSADHQEGHGIDADGRGGRAQVDADVPRRGAQGRVGQLRVRRVAHGGGGGRERGDRGLDRRGADRADDPAVPRRPPERDRRRVQYPAGPARIVVRALGDGQHDQHHVAGRHGAGDRHPRRRGDGDDRERARADGAHAEHRHGGAARQQRHGGAAAAGACSASCRCSSRRSSWPTRCGRCSCR